MELQKGQVVRSRAGNDAGGYFAVVALEGRFALVADGRGHTLEKPKRKNIRHLGATAATLPPTAFTTNKQLHKTLRELGFCPQKGSLPEGGKTLG